MSDTYNLKWLQDDIGITDDETVFADAEIADLWTRSSGVHNETVLLALRQMVASSYKLYDYTAGLTSERRSQVVKNLKDRIADLLEQIDGPNQIAVAGISPVPTRYKDKPHRAGQQAKEMRQAGYQEWDGSQ